MERGKPGLEKAPLCLADCAKFGLRCTAGEERFCLFAPDRPIALSKLKQRTGKIERTFTQVRRRISLSPQDGEHVACLERGPDTAPDRRRSIAHVNTQLEAERSSNRFHSGCQRHSRFLRPNLGGRSHRNIDKDAGRARSSLLGQDTRHELTVAIEIERAFDPYQQVVGRAEVELAAPCKASSFGFDYPAQVRDLQRDRGHHLHGIGGPGRRSDRPARGLGDAEARSRYDGDHDRRSAIARKAANAVLVEDQPLAPVEGLPRILHCTGQGNCLIDVQPISRARCDEGSEV